MVQPGEVLLGKYRVEALIGRGAFAEVYRVTHVALRVPRALKLLRRDAPGIGSTEFGDYRGRFELEAQLGARLNSPTPHPHLIQVFDFPPAGDVLALEMEYAPGGSLADRLARLRDAGALLAVDEAVRIAQDVASGLAALHAVDAVHRDLKPSNILFNAQGRACLADLGLAQVPGGSSQRTLEGSQAPPHPGTPGYKSPEQEVTRNYLTPASDVYALAAVLFEMLTGRVYRSQRPGTRASALRGDVPAGLDELLARMLAPKPEDRPWDGAEVAQLLEAVGQQIEREKAEVEAKAEAAAAARRAREQEAAEAAAQAEAAERARRAEEERQRNEADQRMAAAAERARREAEETARRAREREAAEAAARAAAAQRTQEQPPSRAGRRPLPWAWLGLAGLVLLFGGWGLAQVLRPTPTPQVIERLVTQAPAPEPAAATFTPIPPSATPGPAAQPIPEATVAPVLGIGSTWTSPADGMVQVYVPAGEFLMGSADSDGDASSDEKPQHRVILDAYWIDRTEVTKDQYQQCVAAGKCAASSCSGTGEGNHPVVCVAWQDAANYCGWAGRRLPTEAEWEKAARGTDGRKYPWGNQGVAGDLLNFADRNLDVTYADKNVDDGYQFTAPVGSYPKGASPYGALDMAGNVWEWAADWYSQTYYASSPAQNPLGPDSGQLRVMRGGSWDCEQGLVRAAVRSRYNPEFRDDSVGFRCARSN